MEENTVNIKATAKPYSVRKIIRNGCILVIALLLAYANYKYVSIVYENRTHFSHLSELEREMSLYSEQAFYYSYYKTMLEEKPLVAGISKIMYDKLVEHPKEVNALNRFNIHPEVMIGALYRYLEPWLNTSMFRECHMVDRGENQCPVQSCIGIGEPIVFYLEAIWSLAGLMLAAVFLHGIVLSETVLGGAMSAAQFLANHSDLSRVKAAPNLRENFAIPLLFLQTCLLTVQLRNRERRTSFQLQITIFILNCLCLLFWQFTQFIFLTQTAIFFVMEQLRIIDLKTLCVILHSHFCGLHMAVLLLHGNDMLKSSLYTSFFLVVTAYCLFFSSLRINVQNRTDLLVESWLVLLRISIVICSSIYLKKVLSDFLEVNEDSHVWEILYSKFTNYKSFHTLIYTCAAVFNFISFNEIYQMSSTLLIPLVIFVCFNLSCYWITNSCHAIKKEKEAVLEEDKKDEETDDSGIENNAEIVGKRKDANLDSIDKEVKPKEIIKDGLVNFVMHLNIDPATFYSISQMVVFGLLAFLIMRLKGLFVPQLCVVSSLLMNAKYYAKSNCYLLPVFWAACFSWISWTLVARLVTDLVTTDEFHDPDKEQLLQWVVAETSAGAAFAGSMPLMAAVLLSARRPVAVHPHYEHKESRDRTYAVYKMYGRFTAQELYQELTKLKVSYLVVEKKLCYAYTRYNSTEPAACSHLALWDAEAPALRPRPALCHTLLTERADNLYRVFDNRHYSVFRVHDLSVRYMPRSFDS